MMMMVISMMVMVVMVSMVLMMVMMVIMITWLFPSMSKWVKLMVILHWGGAMISQMQFLLLKIYGYDVDIMI